MNNLICGIPLLVILFFSTQSLGRGNIELVASLSEYNLEHFAGMREVKSFERSFSGEDVSLADVLLSLSINDLGIKSILQTSVNIILKSKRVTGKNFILTAHYGVWDLDLQKIEAVYIKTSTHQSNNYSHFGPPSLCRSEVSSFKYVIAIIENTKEVICNTESDFFSIPNGYLKLLKATVLNNRYISDYIVMDINILSFNG